MHAALELLERRAAGVERDDLAVEDRVARAELRPEPAQLRVARRDVVAVAALEPQPPAVDVADRAHAVPLDLVGPLAVVARERARAREHRLQPLRHRLALRILGRIHAVDHPVVAAGPEQDVAAVQALAVEGDHHLLVAELVRLVGPAVPDLHRAGAVLAGRDVARELDVLERVVLGVDGQVVLGRIGRDALRDRPGDEDAVALQAEIPVQPPRVVLVDHEAVERLLGGRRVATRLGRGGEVALGAVTVEAVGH